MICITIIIYVKMKKIIDKINKLEKNAKFNAAIVFEQLTKISFKMLLVTSQSASIICLSFLISILNYSYNCKVNIKKN